MFASLCRLSLWVTFVQWPLLSSHLSSPIVRPLLSMACRAWLRSWLDRSVYHWTQRWSQEAYQWRWTLSNDSGCSCSSVLHNIFFVKLLCMNFCVTIRQACSYFNSNTVPLRLSFLNMDPHGEDIEIIYKVSSFSYKVSLTYSVVSVPGQPPL